MIDALAPNLVVDAIEPCLPFWTERLGFELVVSVPHGEKLGFALVARDGIQVMYQTPESLEEDAPGLVPPRAGAHLYLTVPDIDAIEAALAGLEPVVPRRVAFYGATEIAVREPGGHVVWFAQPSSESNPKPS